VMSVFWRSDVIICIEDDDGERTSEA